MNNKQVARLLRSVAIAYQLQNQDSNRFKVNAYENAALAIETLDQEVLFLWKEQKLGTIPGIGQKISQHLDELFRTGQVKHFNKLLSGIPEALFELIKIRGIGPKTALKLCQQLKIVKKDGAIDKLKKAVENGQVALIEGLGEESAQNMLVAIKNWQDRQKQPTRMLLFEADHLAKSVVNYLDSIAEVDRVDVLGSLRRRVETVRDLDIACSSYLPKKVVKKLLEFSEIDQVISAGDNSVSLLLKTGEQVDIKTQSPESYGSLLQHFTGSKQHNVRLRELALGHGLSLSEHGIKSVKSKKIEPIKTEVEFYHRLGLSYIPPELRENNGEIENPIPILVEPSDIKGDLHLHSNFPTKTSHDYGLNSMDSLVAVGHRLGYQYLAFTEHNPDFKELGKDGCLEILKNKKELVEQKKSSWVKDFNIRVFNGLEIDIRSDGQLSIPLEGLKYLDFATISIHYNFSLDVKVMTQRVLTAFKADPKIKILAHPTGRILNQRPGYQLDWDKIFDYCQKENKFLEVNSSIDRLDLPDQLIRQAVKGNVKLCINSDAHSDSQMLFLDYGVDTARRGWAQAKDIINCLPFDQLSDILV
ncbi:MAG: helix-hairpin-helix domain-containing protein [Patescibacteria group bacterium]